MKKEHFLSKKEIQQFLYRELLRLTTLVDESLSEQRVFGMMSALVKKARYNVNAEHTEERIEQLLHLMYQEWGFCCDHESYFHSNNIFIDRVLSRKQGMPVSVGAVMLYLASVLNLPLMPVNFPTQLIVRADIEDESGKKITKFINPWNGSYLDKSQLSKWLEGEMGFGAELKPAMLAPAEPPELLERLETVLKMALSGEGRYEDVLKLIEYRLAFEPQDPYEIRDRGMVLASLNCFHAAYEDLSYFIDQCPDDPSAVMLKFEIANLKKQSQEMVIH